MDSQWLNQQFAAHPEKTRAALAAALGLGPPAVSKMLSGTRQIKVKEYAAMRRFFGLPVDGERAVHGRPGAGYVLNPLSSGLKEKAATVADDAWIMPASLMQGRTKAAPEQIRIFAVQDNAMAPDLLPGEWVLVDLSELTPSPAGIFVVSDGFGHILRQVEYVPHSKPAKVRLSARNGSYEPFAAMLDKANIIGRVIAKLQWL